jgi:HEPN domain-containing protein
MTQGEASAHLRNRASIELKTAGVLLGSEQSDVYAAVLFHCHLSIELALKSCYVEQHDTAPPFTHNINELVSHVRGKWSTEEQDAFDKLSSFCILARYGDEDWFEKQATKENAKSWFKETEKFLTLIFA